MLYILFLLFRQWCVESLPCVHLITLGFVLTVITKLGKKLNLRQRVIATAIVFFRRFYIKNAYCETDPFTVIAACCYVAGKAEESPVHIKNVVAEARLFFSRAFSCLPCAMLAWFSQRLTQLHRALGCRATFWGQVVSV